MRVFIEAGATLYASRVKEDYDKEAFFCGEDLVNMIIEGRETADGQSEYEWRLSDLDDRFSRVGPEILRWQHELCLQCGGQQLRCYWL